MADGIACVAICFGVAALLGLDPFGSAAEFVLAALAGGTVYRMVGILIDAARDKIGRG